MTTSSTSAGSRHRLPRRLVRGSTGPLVAAALLLGGCATTGGDGASASSVTATATDPADGSTLVGVEEFSGLLDEPGVTVINVHVPYEGELPDTDAFVAYDEIVGDPALPDDPDAPIALYCRSGNMSAEASALLVEAGFTNITDLEGGMNAWQDAGRELAFGDG